MTDNAAIFTDMAAQIERNKESGFGGAFVIVPPPVEGGEPLSTLILDPKSDPASFWGVLKAKCEIALAELQETQRRQQKGWG